MVREMCKSSMEGRVSIFSLPREILRVIFEYLPLPDLGILDIALVNRKLRSIYLTALDGLIIPRYESSSREIGENIFLNWLIKRKIIAIQIILYSFHAKILQFIRNCRNKIKFLSNYGCSLSAQFLCEVSPFPSLNEIILNNYNIYSLDLLGQFLRLNPQLQSIRLLHQLTPKFINTISYCCPNVKYLDFSGNRWFDDTCIVELVQGNLNNLISLNIADTGVKQDVSIQLILDTYPNLHFFSFFGCTDSSILYRSCLHQVVSPALNSMNWEMQILGLDYMSKLTETQVYSCHLFIFYIDFL